MENQHRRISGYRELSQTEINLMNEVKALGSQLEDAVEKVLRHISDQESAARETQNADESLRLIDATPARFASLAKTEFQTGLMYLTRAVAQPTFF